MNAHAHTLTYSARSRAVHPENTTYIHTYIKTYICTHTPSPIRHTPGPCTLKSQHTSIKTYIYMHAHAHILTCSARSRAEHQSRQPASSESRALPACLGRQIRNLKKICDAMRRKDLGIFVPTLLVGLLRSTAAWHCGK